MGALDSMRLINHNSPARLPSATSISDRLKIELTVSAWTGCTAKTSAEGNESFFDDSGGFEDFALLGAEDAAVLEAANVGVEAAPSDLSYTEESPTITLEEAGLPSAPGAPTPPLALLVLMAAIVAWKAKRDGKG